MLRGISLLLTFLCALNVHAQLNADFTANVTSGCEPLVVNFTDISTGSGITSRVWTFGYGGNISNNNNPTPSAAYPVAGTYTVKLVISNGTQTDSIIKTNYITVHAKPTPSFSFSPDEGCAPLEVSFTNSSSAGSGTITGYQWDFDDGSSFSSQTNPTHTYVSGGNFTPTLKVTNSFGCSRTLGSGQVFVSDGPTAAFNSSANQACNPPLTVNFSNQSTGIGPMSYSWDLDVSTTSATSPTATYTSSGFYDVSLTVTDAYGCSDTLVEDDYVVITEVDAGFEVSDSLCADAYLDLENTTLGASNFTWAWGDGTTSYGYEPDKFYTSGGTYTITLSASSGNCSDTYTKTVYVQEIDPDFTTSHNYGCMFPDTALYTDASTVNFGDITSWYWILGQSTGTSMFGQSYYDSVVNMVRLHAGSYSDTLTVWTDLGCSATIIKNNNLLLEWLHASMYAVPSNGCVPIQVTLNDNSTPTPSYPITNWWWDLGNGDTSIAQNPIVNYTDTGCYDITIVVENAFGCIDTAKYLSENDEAICYGQQQEAGADLSLTPDTACAGVPVVFYDTSYDQTYITDYYWGFDDDTIRFPGALTEATVFSYIFLDTGWINLNYVVAQHGCWDTTYYDSAIYINGPVADFDLTFDCDTPTVRWSDGILLGMDRFYWNFGDGTPLDSIDTLPIHDYAQGGNYQVTLELFNDSNGCTFSLTDSAFVRNIQADFEIDNGGVVSTDSVGCVPTMFSFEEDCTDHEPLYWWYINSNLLPNTLTSTQISRYYESAGFHEVSLKVSDVNGCERTRTRQIFLSDPSAAFDYSFSPGCDPMTVTFEDESVSDTNIVSWQWFLGDASGYHYEQNPVHDYANAGNYQIRLVVTDTVGCADLHIEYLPISFPFPGFYVDTTVCQYNTVTFNNTSNGTGLQYLWNFGNNVTSTVEDPFTFYPDTGSYLVQLAIADSQGCQDTAVQRIHVQNRPVPDLSADTLYSPCLPLSVTFADSTESSYVESWKWNFGDGSNSVLLDTNVAFHNYTTPGLYDISLELTTTYGCKATQTIQEYIEVRGPYAEFDLGPDSACKGETIAFWITQNDRAASYRWVFGDGEDTLVDGTVDTVYHTYKDTVGWRTPVVVYFDSSNTCEIPIVDSVYIHAVYARYDFFPDSVGCGSLNTRLTNNSLGDDTFQWTFGDGRTSKERSPKIYYPTPGTYPLKLEVSNAAIGCEDSLIIPFVVFPLPEVEALGDTLICLGDSAWIEATSDMSEVTWNWSPLQGVSTPENFASYVTPDTTRYYKASASDSNGCVGVDSAFVIVQDVPELDLVVDTTVIIGEEFKLNPSTPDSLIYLWQPSYAFDCDTCKNPWFKAEESNWYSVWVRDVHGCFQKEFKFRVNVIEKYSVDMPDLFSPNGDGVNDAVYVRGWGIEELQEFSIFNRWGQEIFRTNDLKTGWDGTYNGAKQEMDTYAYVVKVKYYDDNEQVINGFIELIR